MNRVDSTYRKTILSKATQSEIVAISPVSAKKLNHISSTIESELRGYISTFPTLFNRDQGSILTESNLLS